MQTSRVSRNEIVAMAGGAILLIALFLPWYETNPDNAAANIDGEKGSLNAFEAHPILQLAAAARRGRAVHPAAGSSPAGTSCRGRAAR